VTSSDPVTAARVGHTHAICDVTTAVDALRAAEFDAHVVDSILFVMNIHSFYRQRNNTLIYLFI
jgi:hypothetical protein